MNTAVADDDRLAFAPPKPPGLLRAFALAVLAHALLMLALMQGLHWKREGQESVVEAELWSALPQQAAPREVPAPPPPPPQPEVKAPPQPEPPVQREADIALEREKQKRELEKQKQAELEREREKQRKLEAQKKKDEELARRKEQQEQETRDAKKLAQLREENLRRMQGMAGTGAPDANGTAARAAGPSTSWAGRVQARVRPNIVFSDDVSGNPKAEVEVRFAPDGTIVGKRLVRSSGVKAWDETVLRALDKTEVLPRDVDGRMPSSPVVIEFRPKG